MFKLKNREFCRGPKGFVLVVALLLGTVKLWAQENSINTFSPYSMYGIGQINTPGSLAVRSMGGAGVAQRNLSTVNLLNPAAYSTALQRSVLFNFGLEGRNTYTSQLQADGTTANTSHCTFNIHDIALQIPLAKHLGLGISLTPYSSVGYRMYNREVLADIGMAEYDYVGEGDVTQVKIGLGWEIFKNFSIGVAGLYYWGNIDRDFTMTIFPYTGASASYPSTQGLMNYEISRLKAQFGVQYSPIMDKRRMLTIGAAYDLGGDLAPNVTSTVIVNGTLQSTAKSEEGRLALVLPQQLSAGVYYETNRFVVALDGVAQWWGSRNRANSEVASGGYTVAYCNTAMVKAGLEWTPNRNDVRNFLKRWHYRVGANYGYYHQTFAGERVPQYAVTLGFGIPVKFGGFSSIDVGFEYGCLGKDKVIAGQVNMLKEQYFKFAVAFSLFGEDYWFVRPKYD